MDTKTIIMTDPARELVELCESIYYQSDQNLTGERHLAEKFGVEPWSREFYQILFTVSERVALVAEIVRTLDLDEDYRDEIAKHVEDILTAFSGPSVRQKWVTFGQSRVGSKNVQPLKAVSGLVRTKVSYKKLSAVEINEVIVQVDELSEWLTDHQLSEQDFIRQALLEGLNQFRFRLDKIQWLGWGYTLDSLRAVIAAYVMLERGGISPETNPDAEAVLRKVGAVIKSVYQKVHVAKNVTDAGDFLLRAYGLGALWYQAHPAVAALLTSR